MSSNQPVYLTAEGLQKIKDELHYLVTTRRREVAQMIAEAKAEGDLVVRCAIRVEGKCHWHWSHGDHP